MVPKTASTVRRTSSQAPATHFVVAERADRVADQGDVVSELLAEPR